MNLVIFFRLNYSELNCKFEKQHKFDILKKDLIKISQLDFIKQLEEKKQVVDKNRPLSKELENRIFQKLKLDWNYNSNAIEGNTFTYGETVALLMEGITAKGKPLKDALDIKGHNDAIQFMLDMIKGERDLNESDIRNLHKLILGAQYENPSINADGKMIGKKVTIGAYKTMPNHVLTSTGETHYYATPEETPAKMTELVSWYNENANADDVNPVVLASIFHHRFVAIHPFDDGNGRMTRILTNFILIKFGYPISVVKNENKQNYYGTLAQADNGEILPFVELMAETINSSLDIYIKGINGEDINDPDDLDKEIELFRKEIVLNLDNKITKEKADLEEIVFTLYQFISPRLKKFRELFLLNEEFLRYRSPEKEFDLTKIIFNKVKDFKELIVLSKEVYSVIYQFNLSHDVYENTYSKSLVFSVDFKEYFYEFSINNKKTRKYYGSKILDEEIKELFTKEIKLIMNELKKYIK